MRDIVISAWFSPKGLTFRKGGTCHCLLVGRMGTKRNMWAEHKISFSYHFDNDYNLFGNFSTVSGTASASAFGYKRCLDDRSGKTKPFKT